MAKFIEIVGKLWPLLATIGFVGGIIWYFANLDGRVRALENEVHTLSVAPAIVDASRPGGPTVANPVAQACADLARKGAEDARYGDDQRIELMLLRLGCSSNSKP
jgi:hypothetical protein